MFQLTYFIGFPLGFGSYVVLSKIWPPAGLGISETMEIDVLEAVDTDGDDIERSGEKPATKTSVNVKDDI
jgi:hypothetical protein